MGPEADPLPLGEPVEVGEAPGPPRIALVGDRIALEPLDPERDAPDLFAGSHGSPATEALWTYMGYGPFADRAAMLDWLETCSASDEPLFLVVVDRGSGRRVGMVSFLMLAAAFDRWGYRRVEWKCDALNARSRRAAERLGFRFEGIFRKHLIVKGRNRDTAWYAMLDDEWPQAKAALERDLER